MNSNMDNGPKKEWDPFTGRGFGCQCCPSSKAQEAPHRLCYEYVPHIDPRLLAGSPPETAEVAAIFVCAPGDTSCATEFVKQIVPWVEAKQKTIFLIQSRNPQTFGHVAFPSNVVLGTTLETNRDAGYREVSQAPLPSTRYRDLLAVDHSRKMVSIEPVMKFDHDIMIEWITSIGPELVWLGFGPGSGTLPEPTRDEVMALNDDLVARGIPVLLQTIREERTTTS